MVTPKTRSPLSRRFIIMRLISPKGRTRRLFLWPSRRGHCRNQRRLLGSQHRRILGHLAGRHEIGRVRQKGRRRHWLNGIVARRAPRRLFNISHATLERALSVLPRETRRSRIGVVRSFVSPSTIEAETPASTEARSLRLIDEHADRPPNDGFSPETSVRVPRKKGFRD